MLPHRRYVINHPKPDTIPEPLHNEALRLLKRQLTKTIYRTLLTDTDRTRQTPRLDIEALSGHIPSDRLVRAPDRSQADRSFARHEASEEPSQARTRRERHFHYECEEPLIGSVRVDGRVPTHALGRRQRTPACDGVVGAQPARPVDADSDSFECS